MGLSKGCPEHPRTPYVDDCTRCNPPKVSGSSKNSGGCAVLLIAAPVLAEVVRHLL